MADPIKETPQPQQQGEIPQQRRGETPRQKTERPTPQAGDPTPAQPGRTIITDWASI